MMPWHRPAARLRSVVALLGVGLAVSLVGCGEEATPEAGSDRSTTAAPSSTVAVEPSADCPVDVGEASALLGEEVGPADVSNDVAECAFEGASWYLAISSAPQPDFDGELHGEPSDAVPAPNRITLGMDRSGLYEAMGVVAAGDGAWMVRVENSARGSDTYPEAEGPAQAPLTHEIVSAVLSALADRPPA